MASVDIASVRMPTHYDYAIDLTVLTALIICGASTFAASTCELASFSSIFEHF